MDRGIPHAFAKTNEGNARLLMTFQPAGKMEEFFIATSEGKLAKMTPEEQDDFRSSMVLNVLGLLLIIKKRLSYNKQHIFVAIALMNAVQQFFLCNNTSLAKLTYCCKFWVTQ